MLVVQKQDMRNGRAWRSAEINLTLSAAPSVGASKAVQQQQQQQQQQQPPPPQLLTLSSLDGEDDIFSLIEVLL
eukprot:COSAG06_NODE_8724_length_2087_cov_1.937123_2_plen_74_part_00